MGAKYQFLVRTRVDDSIQKFGLVYDQTAGDTDAEATIDAITSFRDGVLPELLDLLATDTVVLSVYCRKLDGDSRPTNRYTLVGSIGTRTGEAISAQNVLIFNLRNSAGDLVRPGRLFISGCSKTDIKQGAPNSGGWVSGLQDTAATAFGTAILAIPAGGGSTWAGDLVVRQYHNQDPDPPTYTYQSVDAVDATLEPGSRMSRKGEETGWLA